MEENQKSEIEEKNSTESFKPFVKAAERAENYKSSAYSLLLVGGLGIVFLFLIVCGIIHISIAENIKSVGFIAMLLMFLIFIFIGIKSLIEAKTISALADDEDNLVADIKAYFKENINREIIDEKAFGPDDLFIREEEKFFKREEIIRSLIIDKFGTIEESMLTNEVENMYNQVFED